MKKNKKTEVETAEQNQQKVNYPMSYPMRLLDLQVYLWISSGIDIDSQTLIDQAIKKAGKVGIMSIHLESVIKESLEVLLCEWINENGCEHSIDGTAARDILLNHNKNIGLHSLFVSFLSSTLNEVNYPVVAEALLRSKDKCLK